MSDGWLVLMSAVAGLVGAISGMGSGVILIPCLTVSGIDIKHAIATSVLSVVAMSISASSNYVRGHLANLKASAFLELFAVPGALAGATLAIAFKPPLLFVLCAIAFFISCVLLWKQRMRAERFDRPPDTLSRTLELESSYYDYTERRTLSYHATATLPSGAFMFGTGVISSMLGLGGSALSVLVQELGMGVPPKVAATTSNLITGVMALAGASVYLEAGLIDPILVAPTILGVFMGASVGSWLLVRLSNRLVLRIMIVILFILGLEMLVHATRGS